MTLYTSATNQNNSGRSAYYPPNGKFVTAAVRPQEGIVIPEGQTVQRRRMKAASVYGWITLLSVVFCLIYEQFSFGEHADSMRLMFLLPLVGGVLPFSLLALSGKKIPFSRTAYRLWHSGIAVLMSGCLVKGIIEISGRVSDYDGFYIVMGVLLLAASVIALLWAYRGKRVN